jgi:hypothetical protein
MRVLPAGRADADEVENGFAKAIPRRLALQQDVVPGVELHELRPGDARGEPAALLDRQTLSSRAWSTRVGVRTRGSRAVTSISPRARSSSATISGVVVLRHRSLNQPTCCSVPSGMNREVKTWRNAGLSVRQPRRASSTIAA